MGTSECKTHYLGSFKNGVDSCKILTLKMNEKDVKLVSPRFLYNHFKLSVNYSWFEHVKKLPQ